MKKIILLILLIPTYVSGEVFYTDYYETNEYEESDLLKTEQKYLYRNYIIIRANAKYYEKDTQPYYVPYIDENDHIESFKPIKEYIKDEELASTLKINQLYNVRYLTFKDFSANDAVIKKIKIYFNNEEINYSFTSNNYDFYSKLIKENEIIIDLGNPYDLKNIEIKIELNNENLSEIAFKLGINERYNEKEKNYSLNIPKGRNNDLYTINFNDVNTFDKFIKEKISWINESQIDEIESVNYYKEKVTLYKYYNTRMVITHDYTEEPMEGYLLNYDDYIIETKYYKKDYIEVKDELNNEIDPYELIVDSSVPKEEIKLSLISDEDIMLVIEFKDNIFYKKYIIPKTINNPVEKVYKQLNDNYQNTPKRESSKETKLKKQIKRASKKAISSSSSSQNQTIKTTTTTITKPITITTTQNITTTNKIIKSIKKHNNYFLILILLLLFTIYKYIHKKKN